MMHGQPIIKIYNICPLYHKESRIFGKKMLFKTKCVFLYYLQLLSEEIRSLRRIQARHYHKWWPVSSVGIATDYRLDGPGIEFRWGRDFPPLQTGPGAHPASCTMSTGSFPGVNCGRGVLVTPHPFLVQRSWKSRAIPLLSSGPQRSL